MVTAAGYMCNHAETGVFGIGTGISADGWVFTADDYKILHVRGKVYTDLFEAGKAARKQFGRTCHAPSNRTAEQAGETPDDS